MIPPVDLTQQFQTLAPELLPVIESVLASGGYIGGAQVDALEQELAAAWSVPYVVSCNSGTDALYLALRTLGIGAGDEVITTPFTFFASAEAISMVGATPVFVDVEAHTFNLNPALIEDRITPRTKAILPVHLFGQPVNMTAVMTIANAHGLYVVEDCAQATGACWRGEPVGSIGDIGCFSFFPTKNLGGMGDGGAVTTKNPDWAATMRMLKQHGSSERYYHEAIGVNSRLDSLQAAILRIKLPYLKEWNRRRASLAAAYDSLLSNCPGLTLPQGIAGGGSVWNQYTLQVDDRDHVFQSLRQNGVGCMIYYPLPIHLQAAYAHLGHQAGDFPVAEACAQRVLSLPMFPELTYQQQVNVAEAVKAALATPVAAKT